MMKLSRQQVYVLIAALVALFLGCCMCGYGLFCLKKLENFNSNVDFAQFNKTPCQAIYTDVYDEPEFMYADPVVELIRANRLTACESKPLNLSDSQNL